MLANPDTLASLPTEVVDPLLRSDTSKAQEYLQGLLSSADVGYKTVLRRRPVPLTNGPPDDDYILCFNIGSLKSTRLYIDAVYRKIAEFANLLAGSDISKSPNGWVRLQTLQSYDGRDVPAILIPPLKTLLPPINSVSSPTAIFALCQRTSWRHSLSSTLRPPAKAADSSTPPMVLLRLLKAAQSKNTLYVLHRPPRPSPVKAPPHLPLPAPPISLAPPQYGAYFCSDSVLEPLKRYDINPKTRSRDGYAIKLHPLSSCDSQAIADAIAHSPLLGPQADTLLLVDIPSTQGSHTWTLTVNGLLGTYTAPIPPSHFHSAWQDPVQSMWTIPERHGTFSASVLPTYFPNVPTARNDNLNIQADGRLAAHLTYPWTQLVLDMKELLLSFDRHLITCLIANQVQGNDPLHPDTVLSSFLHHLGQLILLIIAPHDTDDAPPFLQHPEIYGIEFWHAHLNYACTRFAVSHGPDRLLGNQICHWTTGTSETCMKVTHLVVFLPPALGAYVLSRHRTKVSSSLCSADDISMQDGPHTLWINQSALLTPPAVLKHQAEQITNARSRAVEGSLAPYTILFLANTQIRSSKNRVA